MPRFTIELPEAPKGGRYVLEMEPEQAAPASNAPTGMREKMARMEEPSALDRLLAMLPSDTPIIGANANIRGSKAGGYLMGAANLPVGVAQLAANVVGLGDPVNAAIAEKERQYQDARTAAGREGFDAMRLAGNVAGPALLAPVKVPGVTGVVKKGAVVGALGGLAQPVVDGGENFAGQKAVQGVAGAIGGAIGAKVFDKLANGLNKLAGKFLADRRSFDPAAVDAQIAFTLKGEGIDPAQIPKSIMERVRAEVQASMQQGQKIDPAALARQMDFESLGMRGTVGQVTRNPAQFAREKNLSGIEDAGESLQTLFSEQARNLGGKIDDMGAAAADDPALAAAKIADFLKQQDKASRSAINSAYTAARESGENALDVPLNKTAGVFGEMRNTLDMDLLPGPVRSRLASIGLMDGKQTRVFNLDDAQDLIKTINANYDPAKAPQARALDMLRRAVNEDVDSVAQAGNAASLWRNAAKMASDRFRKIESLPALKSVIKNEAPDKFVSKYVIGAPLREVEALRDMVTESPDISQTIRSQVMQHLKAKAFGANAAGDKGFAQETFNRELQKIGRAKLSAIFTPDEVDQLFTIGRVGAYMNSQPAGSVVNTSGTAAAVMNLMNKMGSVPIAREYLIKPVQNALARVEANKAASGAIPVDPLPFTSPAVEGLRNRLAGPFAFGAGAVSAPRPQK